MRGVMGFARVEVVVDTIGRVQTARVLVADHPAFAEAALTAAMDWMFEPAMIESRPVAVRVTIPFRFVIPSLLAQR
jgi:TonB family protein